MDKEKIIKSFSGLTGHTGLFCENLITGESFGYNADDRFAPASVIKLPLFLCIAKWAAEGKADYSEKIRVKNEDKVPGSGALSLFTDEPTPDIRTLCHLMLSLSDNTAANVLIDRFGIPAFAGEFRTIGLKGTVLCRKFYDTSPAEDGQKNTVVLSEIGALLKKVYERSFVNTETSEDIEKVLLHQHSNHKLPGRITDPLIPIAHKTGESLGVSLDVGIVYAVQPFVLCCAGNETDVPELDELIRKTAHEIFCAWNTLPSPSAFTDTGAVRRLVNRQHPLPEDYVPELLPLADGERIDRRCRPYLLALLEDCRAAGGRPLVTSAYRSAEEERSYWEQTVERMMTVMGVERRLAAGVAAACASPPGTGEHPLGLAADIFCEAGEDADFTVRWLSQNAQRYGFIRRYPEGKEEITGIRFESWHYRFVGTEAAEEIYRQGLTLEEYLYNAECIMQNA